MKRNNIDGTEKKRISHVHTVTAIVIAVMMMSSVFFFIPNDNYDAVGFTDTDGLVYEILTAPAGGNGTVKIVSGPTTGALTIPPTVVNGADTYDVISIGSSAFYGCTALSSVNFGNVTTIEWLAFYGCTALSSVNFGNVTTIEWLAFYGCTRLTTVTIPSTVTTIGDSAFENCAGLTSFTVDPSNQNYSSDTNGVLYNKNKTTLIQYPAGNTAESFTIPQSVTTISANAFRDCTGLTTVTIPSTVTTIGDSAFRDCTGLTSIDLGSVQTIGYGAFEGCTGLTSIDLGSVQTIGGGAFEGCTGLTSIDLGSVQTIGGGAFEGCTGLTSIDLGSVQTIGGGAFEGCTGLTSIDLGSVQTIGDYAFEGCAGLTSIDLGSVQTIGDGAFEGCTRLTTVTIPLSVTIIGDYAFEGCTGLTTVTIPLSVTIIGDGAFGGCTGLTTVTIPLSVTIIGDGAFGGCTGLTSIDLGSVQTIGDGAFYGCTGLTSFTVEEGNQNYSSDTNGVLYNKNKTTLIQYPAGNTATSFTILSSVTNITSYAFYGCTGLTSFTVEEGNQNYSSDTNGVLYNKNKTTLIQYPAGNTATSFTIPPSVTTISGSAFQGCTGLTSIDLSSVQTIGNYAFYRCTGLTFIDLDSVQTIGYGAFEGCTGLTAVTIPSSVTTISGSAFYGCTGLTSFTVELSNQNYSSDTNGVLYNKNKTTLIQYPAGNTATSFTIPSSVTSIDNYAFYGCTGLTSFTVEEGNQNYSSDTNGVLYNKNKTTLIQYPAGNTATSFTVPSTVTTIGNYAFSGCTGLTAITVDPSNQNYSSDDDGVLYNKNKTTLIQYPAGNKATSFTIPSTVTTISANAFQGCCLTDVTVEENISLSYFTPANSWKLPGMATEVTTLTIDGNVIIPENIDGKTGRTITFSSTATSTTGGSFYYSDGTTLVNDSDRAGKSFVYSEGKWILAPAALTSDPDDGDNTMLYVGIAIVAVIAVAGIAFFLLRKP